MVDRRQRLMDRQLKKLKRLKPNSRRALALKRKLNLQEEEMTPLVEVLDEVKPVEAVVEQFEDTVEKADDFEVEIVKPKRKYRRKSER